MKCWVSVYGHLHFGKYSPLACNCLGPLLETFETIAEGSQFTQENPPRIDHEIVMHAVVGFRLEVKDEPNGIYMRLTIDELQSRSLPKQQATQRKPNR